MIQSKLEHNINHRVNVQIRYAICLLICQTFNGKRTIFEIREYCQQKVWEKLNRFVNLNKDFNVDIKNAEWTHMSDTIRIVDKFSIIDIIFSHEKVKDVSILNTKDRNDELWN